LRDKPRPYLPVLLALFAGSGCAALIYEIVWFQWLQLAIGSSAVSLGVLLSAYMGGMCLGSLLLARLVPARLHPLKVYAAIELGIGVLALLLRFLVPAIDSAYASIARLGFAGIFPRAVAAGICLIPPTLLMGASLPAISRWIQATPRGVQWLGYFYGGNIAGAVFGCLLAGFYLLRVFDMAVATYAGAAINFAVALGAFALARAMDAGPVTAPAAAAPERAHGGLVFAAIAISGMCALGAEVVWTRLLSLMMGATVYTFSIILAVFLAGLGLGSSVGSRVGRARPQAALGWCQILSVLAIAWTAYTLSDSLPYWPVNPLLASAPWFNFQIDLMRALWTVFPAACLWGASFPLALAALASGEEDAGALVGQLYAANTAGAIAGAIGFSVIFVPWLGTQGSQKLLLALAAAAAILVLIPLRDWRGRWPSCAAALAIGLLSVPRVNEVPWLALAYGRRMLTTEGVGHPLYRGEGTNASIVISETINNQIYFHVSGKVEASTEPFDMRLQRMLGHLPALVHPGPRSVLIVGFGAGVTAGTFVVHPHIQRIVICELEKLIPPAATQYFSEQNYQVLNDRRTEIHYDDARHFILTTNDKFDVITSDPIHPWVKGTATLYSKEYFELVKRHLNPGGVVTQWVPLYESDPATVKSEIATFFDVFPNGTIWANDNNGEGYDVVLLGQAEPTRIDLDALDARLQRPDHVQVAQSLMDAGIHSAASLLGTYDGRASDLRPWLEGAEINRDLSLRLQYLAGLGLNFNDAGFIGREIRKYRRFPEDLFTGSPERLAEMRRILGVP
jgi:spermidine synthase